MLYPTDDLRITWTKVVLPPVFLEEELPITEKASATVFKARNEIIDILNGKDNRLLVEFNGPHWRHSPRRSALTTLNVPVAARRTACRTAVHQE